MKTKLLIVFSIVTLLGVVLIKYPTIVGSKYCPDGSVPLNNDIGRCPEVMPEDIGIETKYSSFTCMEFKDKNKNYAPGEIIIGSNTNVSLKQIQELVIDINATLQKKDPSYKAFIKEQLLSGTDYVIAVPKGEETNVITQILNNPTIKYAELNGCNNASHT
jgi:hypothetical protein